MIVLMILIHTFHLSFEHYSGIAVSQLTDSLPSYSFTQFICNALSELILFNGCQCVIERKVTCSLKFEDDLSS